MSNRPTLSKQTQAAFFDDIVTTIRDTKVTRTPMQRDGRTHYKLRYTAPDQEAPEGATSLLDDFPESISEPIGCPYLHAKQAHDPKQVGIDQPDLSPKDTPGTVWHVGDEPYRNLTLYITSQKRMNLRPQDVSEKTRSAKEAIAHYIPEDAFNEYLAYFRSHLSEHTHIEALKLSLQDMTCPEQCIRGAEETPLSADQIQSIIDNVGDTHGSNQMRESVKLYEGQSQIAGHPEMVLSMAIYHAAHRCYLQQLDHAFDRALENGKINDAQHQNAQFTVNSNSFKQFKHFLLFGTMVPMTLYAYDQQSAEEAERAPTDRMKQAIGTAWDSFFSNRILTRTLTKEQMPPDDQNRSGGGSVTCPAIQHLKNAQTGHVLEDTLDFVVTNLKDTQAMHLAQLTAQAVAKNEAVDFKQPLRPTGNG